MDPHGSLKRVSFPKSEFHFLKASFISRKRASFPESEFHFPKASLISRKQVSSINIYFHQKIFTFINDFWFLKIHWPFLRISNGQIWIFTYVLGKLKTWSLNICCISWEIYFCLINCPMDPYSFRFIEDLALSTCLCLLSLSLSLSRTLTLSLSLSLSLSFST